MSEETDNQRPLETNTTVDRPMDRPRRPRRRFHRRHDGRGRDNQQRGDLNGPPDRAVPELDRGIEGAPTNEGAQQDYQRSDQDQSLNSPNGELEREPEFGDGIIEISGKGFGFLRDAKRNFVQTPNDIFVTPEIVRRFGLRDGM